MAKPPAPCNSEGTGNAGPRRRSRAQAACGWRALINGAAGVVSMRDGEPFSVMGFTVRDRRIVEIDILADPERLSQLDLTILDD